MTIISASNTAQLYAANKNASSKITEVNSDNTIADINDSSKVDTLDERGNNILDQLLVGYSDQDKGAVKLYLAFSMSIKSESIINGKLHIEHEKKTDNDTIVKKLDRGIERSKASQGGYLANDILKLMTQLRDMYISDYSPLDIKA